MWIWFPKAYQRLTFSLWSRVTVVVLISLWVDFISCSPLGTDNLTVVVLDQRVWILFLSAPSWSLIISLLSWIRRCMYFISFSPSVTDSLTVVLDQMVRRFHFIQPIGHWKSHHGCVGSGRACLFYSFQPIGHWQSHRGCVGLGRAWIYPFQPISHWQSHRGCVGSGCACLFYFFQSIGHWQSYRGCVGSDGRWILFLSAHWSLTVSPWLD